MTPSAVIQASDAHASQRAYRAYWSQFVSCLSPEQVQAPQHAPVSEGVSAAVLDGCEDITKRAYPSPLGAVLLVVMLLATIRVYRRTCYPTRAKSPWSVQGLDISYSVRQF
jgi:hypothetical protein